MNLSVFLVATATAMTVLPVAREAQAPNDLVAPINGHEALPSMRWILPEDLLTPLDPNDRANGNESYSPGKVVQPPVQLPHEKRLKFPLVGKYAQAPVVRFVAPRDALGTLLEELTLDDLNRFQFRRNRPEGIQARE